MSTVRNKLVKQYWGVICLPPKWSSDTRMWRKISVSSFEKTELVCSGIRLWELTESAKNVTLLLVLLARTLTGTASYIYVYQ